MGTAASVKMSALLFLPGALLVQAFEYGVLRGSVLYLLGTLLIQFLFGLEFVLKNWRGYKEMAYDFGRNFDQSESINFHYISQELQHSEPFKQFLLLLHLSFLLIFLVFKWTRFDFFLSLFDQVRLLDFSGRKRILNPHTTMLILCTSNFIGMVFSRGTHQQFYAWYSFSFPFLLSACSDTFGPLGQLAILLTLEFSWSSPKPFNALQGHALNVAHGLILLGLLLRPREPTYLGEVRDQDQEKKKTQVSGA